jgi:hypothetical protein
MRSFMYNSLRYSINKFISANSYSCQISVVKTSIPALYRPNFGLSNVACTSFLCVVWGKVNLCTGCVCGDICIEGIRE